MSVEGGARYSEVTGNLGRGLSAFYETDGVGGAFACNFVFHLCQGSHVGEQHRSHGCCCVDVSAAKVENPEARAVLVQLLREVEDVLGGSPESIECGDDKGVSENEGFECSIKLGS